MKCCDLSDFIFLDLKRVEVDGICNKLSIIVDYFINHKKTSNFNLRFFYYKIYNLFFAII